MLLAKILFQIGIGLAGLLALLLDYKWYDKRRLVFKKSRNLLISLSILSVLTSIIVTIYDEREKDEAIKTLTAQLDLIKRNGDKLNLQIEPFLKIATDRYPNLSSEKALDSLKEDIKKIESQTFSLEKSEIARQLREKGLEELRTTPPDIEAILSMDNQRNVSVGVQFHNNVPIKFAYTLMHSYRDKVLSSHTSSEFQLYPLKDKRPIFIKDDFNFREHIPNTGFSDIEVIISYESIYYLESLNSNLRGSVSKVYTVDPHKNILTIKK
jgi:hypothetical protein